MWSGIIENTVFQSNLTLTHPGLAKLVLSSEQNLCSKLVLINFRFNLALVGLGLMMLQGLVPVRRGVFLVSEDVPKYCPQQDWFYASRSCRRITTHLLKSRKSEEPGRKVLARESHQNLSLFPLPVNTAELESSGCLGLGSSCSVSALTLVRMAY